MEQDPVSHLCNLQTEERNYSGPPKVYKLTLSSLAVFYYQSGNWE